MFCLTLSMSAAHAAARQWRAWLICCAAVLALLAPLSCWADLVLGIDDSPSSPAMADGKGGPFMAAVVAAVAQQVAAMQPGEQLVVFWVGDGSTIDVPVLQTRIQRVRTAEGDTAAAYARSIPRFLTQVAEQRRQSAPARQSQLTAGVANARSLISAGQPCNIVLISDLVEADSTGLQYPRDLAKPLPRIPGLDLHGCDMRAYGAGQGLQPKQAQAVLTRWDFWLKAAGACNVQLSRFGGAEARPNTAGHFGPTSCARSAPRSYRL